MIAGMDEAGRGPAIGPLVFGLVIATEEQQQILVDEGVNDSKQLSKKKREKYYSIIKETVEFCDTLAVSATEIDRMRDVHTLNEIEIMKFRQLLTPNIDMIDELQLDAADVNAERFGKQFEDLISGKIDSRHKGDAIFPIVGAASILAKVDRDAEIEQLQQQITEIDPDLPSFGSGYPTQAKPFLEAYVKKYRDLPHVARKSWKTSIDALEKFGPNQSALDEYF